MTRKSIIVYDLKNKKPQEKTDITRKLFGFEDKLDLKTNPAMAAILTKGKDF